MRYDPIIESEQSNGLWSIHSYTITINFRTLFITQKKPCVHQQLSAFSVAPSSPQY